MKARLLLVFCTVIGLSSCSVSTLTIEVLKPAYAPLDTSIISLGIANTVDVEEVKVPVKLNGNELNNYRKAVKVATMKSIGSLADELEELGGFDAVEVKYGALELVKEWGDSSSNLPEICEVYRLDALVALESFAAEVDIDTYTALSSPVDRNEGTVRVPVFYSNQNVNLETLWKVYQCPTSQVLHSKLISSASSYQTESENPYEAAENLPEGKVSLVQVAQQNAHSFSKEIAPFWSKEVREFYLYGSDQLYRAGRYATDGYWEHASEIWFQLTKSVSEKVAEKAKFNMILASEVAGDYDLALNWANEVITKYNSDMARKYRLILERRKKEVDQIFNPTAE